MINFNELDLDTVKAQFKEIVDSNPDKTARSVYTKTEYPNGLDGVGTLQPECVVGQWIFTHGDEQQIAEISSMESRYRSFHGLSMVAQSQIDRDVKRWVNLLQSAQDGGLPWGQAYEAADRELDDDDVEI